MPSASSYVAGSSRAYEPTSGRPPGLVAATSDQRAQDDRRLPVRTDADNRDRHRGHRLDGLDVAPGVLRQVLDGPGGGDVVVPAWQLLVDRLRVVELGLCHRHLVVGLVTHAVAD